MQDLAYEFSKKIFRGYTPGPSQREGATPFRTQHPARPLTRLRAQAPRCWGLNLGLPQLFSRGCAPASQKVLCLIEPCFDEFQPSADFDETLPVGKLQ